MNDKSFVTMEQHQCPICLSKFDTGSLLLDQRLRDRFEMQTLTGHSPCQGCRDKLASGYIALIEAAEDPKGDSTPISIPRTGNIAWVRETAWDNIFSAPIPPDNVCFVRQGLIQQLQEKTGQ